MVLRNLTGQAEAHGTQRLEFFLRYKTSGNGYFFPEAKTYAVVHVVDERGFEAV
jgi:hypothetical protein